MTKRQLQSLKKKYLGEGYKMGKRQVLSEMGKFRFKDSGGLTDDSFYAKAFGSMLDLLTEAIIEDSPWSDNEVQYRSYNGRNLDNAEIVGMIINDLDKSEYAEFKNYCKTVLFQEGTGVVRDVLTHILDVYSDHAASIKKGRY